MKKSILLFVLWGIIKTAYSQNSSLENLKHYRIQLDNRTNAHLKDVPKQILDRYCEGLISAYYPLSYFTVVNFGDFLSHFQWSEPYTSESLFCGDKFCSNPSYQELFRKFDYYLDYYEYSYYNTQTARMERKIPFIQLVYTYELNGIVYNYRGPLFRMDEIGNTIKVSPNNNDKSSLNLSYIFDLGKFYSTEISESNVKNTNKKSITEDDIHEH